MVRGPDRERCAATRYRTLQPTDGQMRGRAGECSSGPSQRSAARQQQLAVAQRVVFVEEQPHIRQPAGRQEPEEAVSRRR